MFKRAMSWSLSREDSAMPPFEILWEEAVASEYRAMVSEDVLLQAGTMLQDECVVRYEYDMTHKASGSINHQISLRA